jgi:hypothetical protein
MFRMSWKAFPKDPGRQVGTISDADKNRIAAMPVEAVLAEVASASVSGKRAAARVCSGPHFVGINSIHGKRWTASIKQGGHGRHLGTFSDAETAARAYDAAAWRSHGRCAHAPANHLLFRRSQLLAMKPKSGLTLAPHAHACKKTSWPSRTSHMDLCMMSTHQCLCCVSTFSVLLRKRPIRVSCEVDHTVIP